MRYSRTHLLSTAAHATRYIRSPVTCCVNLLFHQLCISKRSTTKRKHRGGRKVAKQIGTIIHYARVPTLPQPSRNVPNFITLPLYKQVQRDQGVRVCYVNAQSCRNKTLAIADHILENHLDMMTICETWLKPSSDANVITYIVPYGYSIKHTPKSSYTNTVTDADAFRSFEHLRHPRESLLFTDPRHQ